MDLPTDYDLCYQMAYVRPSEKDKGVFEFAFDYQVVSHPDYNTSRRRHVIRAKSLSEFRECFKTSAASIHFGRSTGSRTIYYTQGAMKGMECCSQEYDITYSVSKASLDDCKQVVDHHYNIVEDDMRSIKGPTKIMFINPHYDVVDREQKNVEEYNEEIEMAVYRYG